MQRLHFLTQNARWLLVPSLMTFGSGFGQTFFISLFAGEIRTEYALSHSAWSGYYAGGTLASALLMMLVGGMADRLPARRITLLVIVLFALSAGAMAGLPAVWALPVVIFGLRFCGQGMMGLLAMVFAGRWFVSSRGKVVAIASVGFSLGESIFPFVFVLVMGAFGWRSAWLVAAAVLLALGLLLARLMRVERQPAAANGANPQRQTGMNNVHWTRRTMLGNWVFWVGFPAFLVQPMVGTVFMFQQVHMVDIKGWALADFAALFPLYSLTGLVSVFVFGVLADRVRISWIMPFYLAPLALGMVVVAQGDGLQHAAIGLVLLGIMQGAGTTVSGVFWPEYYGTRNLGAIRSLATAIMVFATALGPLLSGIGLDSGLRYESQLYIMSGMALAGCLLLAIVALGTRRARA